MKRIGFLSFGHWGDVPGSCTRSAWDALLQAVDLAVAAEDVGVDGGGRGATAAVAGGSRVELEALGAEWNLGGSVTRLLAALDGRH